MKKMKIKLFDRMKTKRITSHIMFRLFGRGLCNPSSTPQRVIPKLLLPSVPKGQLMRPNSTVPSTEKTFAYVVDHLNPKYSKIATTVMVGCGVAYGTYVTSKDLYPNFKEAIKTTSSAIIINKGVDGFITGMIVGAIPASILLRITSNYKAPLIECMGGPRIIIIVSAIIFQYLVRTISDIQMNNPYKTLITVKDTPSKPSN